MAIFKCKMCGGTLEISDNQSTAVCEYCGTQQTLPKLDDEKRANLYDRANHFRRNNEFDKAAAIYEQILNEDSNDAEAYWSLVLCRYGIEYVEDPATRKRVPTVNRAQFTSIFDDDNYKSALQYADGYQKEIYEKEAKAINEIQKGILAISQNEEPFDVFICYKETDNNGRRTHDSVLANDLYHQLKNEGFKVFFSRITLEDKLGVAYEPYIFAALNSAKVMVVLGTKPEYFNAVWVKNEWSRYLSLVKASNGKKIIVPAYRDMDPYDLPEEFSHLQAQDMSKLGFMQDLIRGIKKIINTDNKSGKETVVVNAGNTSVAPLIKRAFLFLEDGNWTEANDYCEKVLDLDPENAEAYLGKMMADLRCRRKESLKEQEESFENNANYSKTIRFATPELKSELQAYINCITERKEQERQEAIYSDAINKMNSAIDEDDYDTIIELFESVPDYKDSKEQISLCRQEIEKIREENERLRLERERQAEIERKEAEERERKAKKFFLIATPIVCAVIAIIIVLNTVIIPNIKYNKVQDSIASGDYATALEVALELEDYKNVDEQVPEIKYLYANDLLVKEDYKNAYTIFCEIPTYKDSADKIKVSGYKYSLTLINEENFETAITILKRLGDYEDSKTKLSECYYNYSKQLYDEKDYENCVSQFLNITDANVDRTFYQDALYNLGLESIAYEKYDEAVNYFDRISSYKDSDTKKQSAMYQYVKANYYHYDRTTYSYLKTLKAANYSDSASLFKSLYAWKATIKFNDSEDDETTDSSSLSKFGPVYCHVSLTGGEPGAKTRLKYKYNIPNGETPSGTFSEDWGDGYTGWCGYANGIYQNPAYGSNGIFSVTIFDGNGNQIGQDSVKITN